MHATLFLVSLLSKAQTDDCNQALAMLCHSQAAASCSACVVEHAAQLQTYCTAASLLSHCAECEEGGGPLPPSRNATIARMAAAVRVLLVGVGEDPAREGLLDTPKRVAKALLDNTEGYDFRGKTVKSIVGSALFHEDHHDMVVVKDIPIYSMCEHHMLPFYGKAHVAYIPSGAVIGLSKLARIADHFSRRLQVQERLTAQIADAVEGALLPKGVMVVIEATHMCMAMRGVRKHGAVTVTTGVRGNFASSSELRAEFRAQLK